MYNYAQMGKCSLAAQHQRKRFRRGRFSRKNRRKDTAKKTLDILKMQDFEPSLITQQRALERSGLSAALAARAAPIDEESPPKDINHTPEQCSTGFEWPNKSSTPMDPLAESSLGNWKLMMTVVLQTVVLVKSLAHPRNEH